MLIIETQSHHRGPVYGSGSPVIVSIPQTYPESGKWAGWMKGYTDNTACY
jgi:hypothetical protein